MNEPKLRDLILIDLDGTLININGIADLIPDWDAFHDASFRCPANEAVVEFVRALQLLDNREVIIVTGKPDTYQSLATEWLRYHGLMPDAILMRPKDNAMSDADLKPWLVEKHCGEGWEQRVLFTLEDRDKMVNAWRARGLTCFQCAESLY